MRKAVVHIGMEKTGTTAIQSFLQANRVSLLKDFRVWVPDYLGKSSQWPLAVLAYDDSRNDDLTLTLGSPASRAAKLDEYRKKLAYSVANNPADIFCFSSEHLSSRLSSVEELERLRRFLDDLFDDVLVVVYVRDPLRSIVSRQSTAIRLGVGVLGLPEPSAVSNLLDFKRLILLWDSVFRCKLKVCLYDEVSRDFDLISEFADLLGVNPGISELKKPERSNVSLSLDQLRLMSRINSIAHARNGVALPRSYCRRVVDILDVYLRGDSRSQRYLPSKAEKDAYRAYYKSQTEWLFSNYFPGFPFMWDSRECEDSSILPDCPIPELTASEEALCQIIARLSEDDCLPLEEVAVHLGNVAWKMENELPFNESDQESCVLFRDQIDKYLQARSNNLA